MSHSKSFQKNKCLFELNVPVEQLPTYVRPVAVAGKERVLVLKESLYVLQTPNLELLRVPVDDLLPEGVDQGLRVEEQGTVGQADVALHEVSAG